MSTIFFKIICFTPFRSVFVFVILAKFGVSAFVGFLREKMPAPRNMFFILYYILYQAVIWTMMMMLVAVGILNLNLNLKGKLLSVLFWHAIQKKNKSLRIVQIYLS